MDRDENESRMSSQTRKGAASGAQAADEFETSAETHTPAESV